MEETQEVGKAGMENAVAVLAASTVAVEVRAEMMGMAKAAEALVGVVKAAGATRSIAHSLHNWQNCRSHPTAKC